MEREMDQRKAGKTVAVQLLIEIKTRMGERNRKRLPEREGSSVVCLYKENRYNLYKETETRKSEKNAFNINFLYPTLSASSTHRFTPHKHKYIPECYSNLALALQSDENKSGAIFIDDDSNTLSSPPSATNPHPAQQTYR